MEPMEEIYRRHARTVYQYLTSLCGQPDVAEELTQETFCQAIRGAGKFDNSCKITTGLCAIAKNQYLAYLRKHPATVDVDSLCRTDTGQGQESMGARTVPTQLRTASAEQEAIGRLSELELLRSLHELSEPYREVFYLRLFGNLAFKEIGEILGRSENWARVTFYRGKENLRKELELRNGGEYEK